jgi:hypothetical protein
MIPVTGPFAASTIGGAPLPNDPDPILARQFQQGLQDAPPTDSNSSPGPESPTPDDRAVAVRDAQSPARGALARPYAPLPDDVRPLAAASAVRPTVSSRAQPRTPEPAMGARVDTVGVQDAGVVAAPPARQLQMPMRQDLPAAHAQSAGAGAGETAAPADPLAHEFAALAAASPVARTAPLPTRQATTDASVSAPSPVSVTRTLATRAQTRTMEPAVSSRVGAIDPQDAGVAGGTPARQLQTLIG